MTLELKNILECDVELQLKLRDFRNSEAVSKFFQLTFVTEEMHDNWLRSLENNNDKIGFVIFYDNIPIGMMDFKNIDYDAKSTDWGMYIYDDSFHNKGIGSLILNKSIKYVSSTLKLDTIFLEVLENNKKGIYLYEKFNFKKLPHFSKEIIKNKVKIKIYRYYLTGLEKSELL